MADNINSTNPSDIAIRAAIEADKRELQRMLQEWREFKRAFLDGLFGRPLQQERSDGQ